MLKQFQTLLACFVLVAALVSCNDTNEDVRDAARENVESATVQPNDPNAQPAEPQMAVPAGPLTTIEFAESTFDFGTVTEGEMVRHTYSFTNTGSEPLIVSDAKGSCGCTVPSKPTEAIAPGGKGEIVVEFNSKAKKGQRNQKVTLTANTNPPQTFIYLTGMVNPDPNAAAPTVQ